MQTINLQKVLLVYNSDSAQSLADANDYISKRGLNSAYKLGFAFGTSNATLTLTQLAGSGGPACTTAPYVGQMFCQAIANFMIANPVEAVILSTYTPTSVDPQISLLPGAVYTLSAFAGASRYVMSLVGINNLFFYFDEYHTQTRDSIETIIANVPQTWKPSSSTFGDHAAVNPYWKTPHGRLGSPDYGNANIAEQALGAGGSTIYANAVAKGLAGELVGHTGAQHAFTQTLNYSIVTAALNKTAFDWAKRLGMPNVANMGVDYTLSNAGTPPITLPAPLFALCLGNQFNSPSGLNAAYTCAAGAWGFMWTSSAGIFGNSMLYNGAAAAVLTYGEPYSDGIPMPNELFLYASYYKMPLMLAHFLARSNNMGSTVCGDPLYTPYLSTPTIPPVISMPMFL